MNLADIPFNRVLGLEPSPREGFLYALPADVRYTNHLGTVHAGALLALAEATSGARMLAEFGHLGADVLPVVRRLEAKFRRPARGAVHARARVDEAEKTQFLATLAARGRALVHVQVDLFAEGDAPVAGAMVEWFVGRAS